MSPGHELLPPQPVDQKEDRLLGASKGLGKPDRSGGWLGQEDAGDNPCDARSRVVRDDGIRHEFMLGRDVRDAEASRCRDVGPNPPTMAPCECRHEGTMRAARCSRSPSTVRSPGRRQCVISPSGPVFHNRIWSRFSSL